MEQIIDLIGKEAARSFVECGYEEKYGMISLSNRPDLCEYQCNGAMAGAKQYKKAPIMIANEVAQKLADSAVFAEVNAVAPGFLNLKIKESFLGKIEDLTVNGYIQKNCLPVPDFSSFLIQKRLYMGIYKFF